MTLLNIRYAGLAITVMRPSPMSVICQSAGIPRSVAPAKTDTPTQYVSQLASLRAPGRLGAGPSATSSIRWRQDRVVIREKPRSRICEVTSLLAAGAQSDGTIVF